VSNIAAVHAAVSQIDNAAADALWHCLNNFSREMQASQKNDEIVLRTIRALKESCLLAFLAAVISFC
jgi:predicted RND superfamily exporter protein